MNGRIAFLFLALLLATSVPAYADLKSANRITPVNKTTDFLATVGKSDRDKREILQERRAIRRDVRLKEEARRKRVEMRKRMKAQEAVMMRKVNAQ